AANDCRDLVATATTTTTAASTLDLRDRKRGSAECGGSAATTTTTAATTTARTGRGGWKTLGLDPSGELVTEIALHFDLGPRTTGRAAALERDLQAVFPG